MKKTILMASAIAAFVIPTTAPLAAEAAATVQERERNQDRRAQRQERREQRSERPARQERQNRPSAQITPEVATDLPETRNQRRLSPPGAAQRQNRPTDDRSNAAPRRQQAQPSQSEPRRDGSRDDRREDRRENRQERRDARPDRPRQERPGADRPNVRQERREDRREFRQERREDRREYRQDRREDRAERRQDRRDYREFRNRWNQDAWRRSWAQQRRHDWWRSNRGFSGYSGLRVGFYFAPSYGYYSVPRQYWGQRYYEGQYLPQIFWRYQVNDWRTYGLGYPPEGTAWVHVDNHLYLIDRYDGYIISVAYDAWRW